MLVSVWGFVPKRAGTEDPVGCLSYLHMNARTPQKLNAQEDFTQCSPHESKQCAEVNGAQARKRTSTDTRTLFAIVTTGSCSKAHTDIHLNSQVHKEENHKSLKMLVDLRSLDTRQNSCFNHHINWLKMILDHTLFWLFICFFSSKWVQGIFIHTVPKEQQCKGWSQIIHSVTSSLLGKKTNKFCLHKDYNVQMFCWNSFTEVR